jgi:hypothetical protein
MTEEETKQRFDELLPWYVNETLSAEERTWFEAYLESHPEAASELRWHESLQARIQESAPRVSPDIGLSKLMARIREERRASSPTFAERLAEFFGVLQLRPAMAAAAALIVIQAAVIGALLLGEWRDEEEYAAVRSVGQPLSGSVLKVNFKPDAKEAEMRLLLIATGGELIAGPTQLGDYYVHVSTDRLAQASNELKASAIVEAVSVVQTLPQKE